MKSEKRQLLHYKDKMGQLIKCLSVLFILIGSTQLLLVNGTFLFLYIYIYINRNARYDFKNEFIRERPHLNKYLILGSVAQWRSGVGGGYFYFLLTY